MTALARARRLRADAAPETAGLAALLVGMGILHFAQPKPFDALIPPQLPGPERAWTYASGAAELGVGLAVALPRTRRLGAGAAAALFVAVFPANIYMAVKWRRKPLPYRAIAYGRLPLQIPLVLTALKVRRGATSLTRPAG